MSFNIYLLLVCLSAIVGLVYFVQKQTHFKKSEVLLLICLLMVLTFEGVNQFLVTLTANKSILHSINWFYIVPGILTYYFAQQFRSNQSKAITIGIMVALMITGSLGVDWFLPKMIYLNLINFLPLWTLVLLLAAKNLIKVFTIKDYAESNILSIPQFWVCIGVIFFYLETAAIIGILYLFPQTDASLLNATLNFSHFLGGVMFMSFGFSFYAPRLFAKTYRFF